MTETRFSPRAHDGRLMLHPGPEVEVPAEVRAAAMDAFRRSDRDTRVLDLLTDTVVDDRVQAGARRLRFLDVGQGADVAVVVRDLAAPGLVSLSIVVRPESAHVAAVLNDEGAAELCEVRPGRWRAGPLRHGLTSIVVDGTGSRLRTAWVRV